MKSVILIFSIIIFCACTPNTKSPATQSNTGMFDEICLIVKEALKNYSKESEQAEYIRSNIERRIQSKDIAEAYFSLAYIEPENRYQVFQTAVESTIYKKWDCNALKEYLDAPTKTSNENVSTNRSQK